MTLTCSICGGQKFVSNRVLWPDLIAEWELEPHEADYIDRQQGERCINCNASLRHIALGNAFRTAIGDQRTIREIVEAKPNITILDLNGAEVISEVLSGLSGYVRGDYPEIDMQNLPYAENSFDVVLHSDTLEHVPNPLVGLNQCMRVLRPGGWLCYTVPIVVGRATRSRAGMPKSFHGDPSMGNDDYVVHTEFGADAWTYLARAGFTQLGIQVVSFPAAHALTARKTP
ncbi:MULTISPECIES: bifunctional 2-polyprenyl-6-hydroxyphenol methylase/3-demethylubiquinol 3-O-methyltransferase UbiG [unclassified Ruegeria]|uniref:class I SAM-dependent methyltransferase n=1 Tax=unclassified Ruegeria TaxID=2625375 RepID=UPI001488A157|nr:MULTISPECIES: class I SAM-dependent methyltransferase [unclassified Ruegeria]NOD64539.1 methyltransferase domain-containing protein [Ruegeria sp. HKCCD6109]